MKGVPEAVGSIAPDTRRRKTWEVRRRPPDVTDHGCPTSSAGGPPATKVNATAREPCSTNPRNFLEPWQIWAGGALL
jgi:hypothetical protein